MQQKEGFTKDARGLAHMLIDKHDKESFGVDDIDSFASEVIQGLKKAHRDNSTEYAVKIKERQISGLSRN